MASIGLRHPFVAKYGYDVARNQAVYSEGRLLAKAVEYSDKIEVSEDSALYADDGAAESAAVFAGGELSVTTDDLAQDASALILGAMLQDVQVGDSTYQELVLDDDANAPYLGFGLIIPRQHNGIKSFRAVVWHKIKFSIPEGAAKTMADKIEWQTPKLTAKIFRSDAGKHPVKSEIVAPTLEEAIAYIKQVLNIQDLKSLSVTSTPGSTQGKTKLAVSPSAGPSNVYKYKTGKAVDLPRLGQNLESWTSWTGTSEEIKAKTGDQIVVAECDAGGAVVAAGSTTVRAHV